MYGPGQACVFPIIVTMVVRAAHSRLRGDTNRPYSCGCRRKVCSAAAMAMLATVVMGARLPTFLPGPSAAQRGRLGGNPMGDTPRTRLSSKASAFQQVDAEYNPTWTTMEESSIANLEWVHPQTFWVAAATGLFSYDVWRFFKLVPPTDLEAMLAGVIYLGLYTSRYQEVEKLDRHYQVSFYASCGWTLYAFASLLHSVAYSPDSVISRGEADAFHGGACAIFLGSCAYFYAYHWGRMWRHWNEGRFRPWFAAGLASLTLVHGLTFGHIYKSLDDPLWWQTVNQIYPDEWRFLADSRLVELYLTAAALFLVILHLRGVLTGTKNATIVFLGTVILPTLALFFECFFLKADVWNHFRMVGPKYF